MKKVGLINNSIPLEFQLIALCCINDLSEEQMQLLLTLAASDLDWDYFLQLVMKNRVFPLVYRKLSSIDISIDRDIIKALEKKYKSNVLTSIAQLAELIKVAGWIKSEGIRIIPLKGPILSKQIYHDVSMRTSSDLDILADQRDVENIESILLKNGYHASDRSDDLPKKQRNTLLNTYHHFSYRNARGICIELHWKYSKESDRPDFEEIWKRSRTIQVSGEEIHILSKEDNLAYLILHGAKHGWKRLRWLCDVYEIIKGNDIDWQLISFRMKELESFFMLEQTVILLKELFGMAIPEAFKRRPLSGKSVKLARMVLPFVFSADDKVGIWGYPLCIHMKKYMLITLRIREQIAFLTRHLHPTSDDFKLLKLKDEYFFLYYILHPLFMLFRLFKRIGK